MPTDSPTVLTAMVITPRVGGGKHYKTYWVIGRNILLVTRAKSIQAQRPNDFHNASIIAKNCMEGLPDKKELSLDESKSKTTLISWIACITSYMKDNGMDTVFHVYDPYLKTEV